MAEAIERLKRKRSSLRNLTTRLLNKVKEALDLGQGDSDNLEELNEQLKEKEKLLKEIDSAIENAITELDELDNEIATSQDYQERIICAKSRIARYLRRNENHDSGSVNRSAEIAPAMNPVQNIRLPRLNVEKFKGDVADWQRFWAQYDSAFHANQNLTKIDKFNYLKTLVDGEAATAIAGLTLTENNYDAAIEILKDRFGQKDIIISSYINKLLGLTPVKRASDLNGLRKLYDTCQIQIRGLQSAGIELNSFGNLLLPLLMKLVPEMIALEFNRRQKGIDTWNVSEFLKYLKDEIENREKTQQFCKTEEVKALPTNSQLHVNKYARKMDDNRYRNPRLHNEKLFTTAALSATVNDNCVFCDKIDHKAEGCSISSITERKNILKRKGKCFVCLKGQHIARTCRSKQLCENCGRKHNKVLCEKVAADQNMTEISSETVVSSLSENSNKECEKTILLQTARALAVGKERNTEVRCLLDGGSQRTFILQSLSRSLNLPVVEEETLTIHTFGVQEPKRVIRQRVKLRLQDLRNGDSYVEIEALEAPNICSAKVQVPSLQIQNYCAENRLQLADEIQHTKNDMTLTILIGADYYWKVVTGNTRRINCSLMAVETKFGWMIHGPNNISSLNTNTDISIMEVLTESIARDEDLATSKVLRKFWELDSIGIMDESDATVRLEENEFIERFESTLVWEDKRYKVRLPWKDSAVQLNDNKDVATKRFKNLVKRFEREPNMYFRYKDVMDDYLKRGIAEVVPPNEVNAEKQNIYYMPHRAVIKEDRTTTKVRVVFDASSHAQGAISLNNCLSPGPNLNPCLLDLIIKFRLHPIAFTADIEQAFLQISLDPEDRDAVRFLWLDGPLEPNCEMKTQILRMTRVLFGVTSSPFLLAATVRSHIKRYTDMYPEACKMLDKCLYVDDLISGTENVEQAIKLSTEIKLILEDAGMNMRKWRTNSNELKKKWIEQNNVDFQMEKTTIGEESEVQRVLGLSWAVDSDHFTFDNSGLLQFLMNCHNTKRGVLQTIGRIFDPVGLLTPFTMRSKILFQELWELGLKWDDILPNDLLRKWTSWCEELSMIGEIRIPRYYFSESNGINICRIQLHCFCDASERAYGAVIYMRYELSNGKFGTVLVTSKARVAPLKKLTLPRLELMGAVVGARLAKYVMANLEESFQLTPYFWTDSMITLCWIRSSSRQWKPFVQNRVAEIHSKTEPSTWLHCPGVCNPADLLTRGVSINNLTCHSLWWYGPDFLRSATDEWPKEKTEELSAIEEFRKEIRADFKNVTQASCVSESCMNRLLDIDKFSKLTKLLRITAWILRFIHNSRHVNNKILGPLTADDMATANVYWIRTSQNESFSEEIKCLESGKTLMPSSMLCAFRPFLDAENILRIDGRLQESSLPYDQVHPIILSGKDHFSELVIKDTHEKIGHAGVSETLAQIREQFWIIRGRQRIKSVIYNCNLCKKFRVKPATQETATLPPERINEAPPFHIVGLDFAGPLYLKNERKIEKGYIVLISCAVTRAVHLELVSDMTMQSFMLAFKRFIGRRGICKTVFSDNAKTFKATHKELKEIWNHLQEETLQDFFGRNGISWKFNVERAAWWGGFWERLVRSVKSCLKKILGKAWLKFDEMQTTLVEIEAILNSRPLTFVYNLPNEPTPLTPSHFLIGQRLTLLPPKTKVEVTGSSGKQELIRRYEYRERLLSHFWERWRKNYLCELRSAHRISSHEDSRVLREGSVVLIYDAKQPRLLWKMAIITHLQIGRDGKIRSCDVRLPNGTVVSRPLQLLCPLELESKTALDNAAFGGGGCCNLG